MSDTTVSVRLAAAVGRTQVRLGFIADNLDGLNGIALTEPTRSTVDLVRETAKRALNDLTREIEKVAYDG